MMSVNRVSKSKADYQDTTTLRTSLFFGKEVR